MSGYSTREVAELIGVTPAKVRAFARAVFVSAQRETRHSVNARLSRSPSVSSQ